MLEKVSQIWKNNKEDSSSIKELSGTRVAIVATDGFEESELFKPKEALEEAGVETCIVSLKDGKIKGWNGDNWGRSIQVDLTVLEAMEQDFDYLMLPGGVINPDHLRNDANCVAFVETFVNSGKPIAAICHGVQTLIETGGVKGKTLTSWPSLRTDLINAGANWVDSEVIVDHRLITSRRPSDIPAFNSTMIREFIDYHISHNLANTETHLSTH